MKNIVVFEDNSHSNFYPLDQLRASFELKIGMFSFLERIFFHLSESRYHLLYREELKSVLKNRYPDFFHNTANVGLDVLFINGRVVFDKKLQKQIEKYVEEEFLIVNGSKVLCFRLKGSKISAFIEQAKNNGFNDEFIVEYFRSNQGSVVKDIETKRFEMISELISENGAVIREDFKTIDKGGLILSKIGTHSALTKERQIYIGKNTRISPLVHIDASKGPVYIGSGVEVKSNVLIEGPVFIDNNAKIFSGYIRENTSIGESCRVGGEVEDSVFLANTNKYHAGFVGHSYVGEWVNFGAMTTTSDLKNNYKEINLLVQGNEIATNTMFIGSIVGDHSKFGIGTMLNTGTVVGIGSNIVDSNGSIPKEVSPFSWLVNGKTDTYVFDKFLETAQIVSARRGQELSANEESLLKHVYSKVRLSRVKRS